MFQEKTLRLTFRIAAVYNIFWGVVVILFPNFLFDLAGIPPINYPFLMSGIGMFVAVYGYGYWVVANEPLRYPQLVVIGFLGKTLGPIGWIYTVAQGLIPARTLWVNVFNDLIWLPFFIGYFVWYRRQTIAARSSASHSSSLYRRLLGADFDKLDPTLRTFHDSMEGGGGSGTFTIIRGEGMLRGTLARLLGLPSPGENRRVDLQVIARGGTEQWIRRFGDDTLHTLQWEEDGLLAERAGPMLFRFRLSHDAGGLRFEHHSSELFGISIPKVLAPRVRAYARGVGERWEIEVGISLPLAGTITSYRGYILPTS